MRASVVAAITLVYWAAAPASAQERAPANQLHYPLSDDLADMLRTAEAAVARGELEAAIDLYRTVLDQDGAARGGYQLAPAPVTARGQPRRYVGVTERAIAGLRALPPQGVKVFRARYDYRAGSALEAARGAPDPFVALARVYELYPISGHAPRLLEAMADLALERGDLERAARTLELLLTHHADEAPDPLRARRKLLLCAVSLGQPERVRALAGELHRGERGKVDDLVLRAIEAEERRAGRTRDAGPGLSLVRMDPENRAVADARSTVGPARFSPRTFESQGAAGGFERFMPGQPTAQVPPSRHLPLLHEGRVFLSTADQVFTFDARTGEQGPRIPRLGPHFPDTNAKVQFGGAITRDTFVAPLVNDVVNEQQFRGIPIKVRIPLRKLAGFDVPGWRWIWNHARTLDGTPYERWSFPTPPTAVEGLVFAPAFALEGFVNCHVAAFDARTGERVWTTWVVSGQVEQTMFGEHSTEPLCAPVAVSGGVVYYSSSFGAAAALDASTGRPLWVTEYEQIEVRPPKGFYPEPRDITWENNAVTVVSGVVVIAPLDSPTFLGLDARTGERLWEARQRIPGAAGMLAFIVAASQHDAEGAVVLGGGAEVRCVGARSGKLLWRADVRGRTVAGRGCVADGQVLVPLTGNEVALFDLGTGKRSGTLQVGASGNVVLVGEHALVTGSGKLVVHRIGSRDF
ncbi:MAG: PQQ-like beta-propeller repeat protein [Planctomycetes bacterium]|nr:PQQ-like beta-propeller repeat protein [Planctomycetota bacterium]